MEPIDYRDALVRRWWLILTLMVLGAVVGVVAPVHKSSGGHTAYQATALIGIPPGGSKSAIQGSPVDSSEIIFLGASPTVIENAAHAAGVKKTKGLTHDVAIIHPKKKATKSSKKGGGIVPPGSLEVSVRAGSAKKSAKLTNAYAVALHAYVDGQLASVRNTAVADAQGKVDNLQGQIDTINTRISNTNCAASPTASTTAAFDGRPLAATLVADQTSTTEANAPTAAANAPATPTTTVPLKVTTTVPPKPSTTVPPTPTTTVPPKPKSCPALTQLQTQLHGLQSQLNGADQKLNQAMAKPTKSGIVVLDPATAGGAKKLKSKSSSFSHRSTRLVVGALAGLALGIGLSYLLDARDRTLRRTSRVQETFGFPLVAEIPAPAGTRPGIGRRSSPDYVVESTIAIEHEPMSPTAEAYRGLRTAILIEPLAAERLARRAANGSTGTGEPKETLTSVAVSSPAPGSVTVAPREALIPARGRQVVLVVSPKAEPSRGALVANLAAAYAEAGDEALVVTTASLRDRAAVLANAGRPGPSEIRPEDISAAARQTHLRGVSTLGLGWVVDGPGHLATRGQAVLEAARQVADVVLVESSLLTNHDVEAMLPHVDVVVAVAQYRRTRSDEARRSGETLRRFDAPVLGVVFTAVPTRGRRARVSGDPDVVPAGRRARQGGASRGVTPVAPPAAAATRPTDPTPAGGTPTTPSSTVTPTVTSTVTPTVTGPTAPVSEVPPGDPSGPATGTAGPSTSPVPGANGPGGAADTGDQAETLPPGDQDQPRRRRWGRRPPGSPDD